MQRFGFLLLAVVLFGCETQQLFDTCPLDQDVLDKLICNGTVGTVSCVVKHHPQCDQSVCISYNSNASVCTRACETDADCTGGAPAFCYEFAEAVTTTTPVTPAQKYCVKVSDKAASSSK